MIRILFLAFGGVFGFLLSQARATDFKAISGMFLLKDLHLFGVIGTAIGTAGAGLWAFRRLRASAWIGGPIESA